MDSSNKLSKHSVSLFFIYLFCIDDFLPTYMSLSLYGLHGSHIKSMLIVLEIDNRQMNRYQIYKIARLVKKTQHEQRQVESKRGKKSVLTAFVFRDENIFPLTSWPGVAHTPAEPLSCLGPVALPGLEFDALGENVQVDRYK